MTATAKKIHSNGNQIQIVLIKTRKLVLIGNMLMFLNIILIDYYDTFSKI